MKYYTNVALAGNKFAVRGYENGKSFSIRDDFKPTLYVKTNNKTDYKTLDGEYVKPINPGSPYDCREFFKKYDSVNGFSIYGNERYVYQYISEKFSEKINFNVNDLKICIIDIEVASENGFPDVESSSEEILAITIQDYNTRNLHTWGVKPFKHDRKDLTYHYCEDEERLIHSFLDYWSNNYPDIVTGWNCKLYDIPYICRRIERIAGEKYMKMISPWNFVKECEVYVTGRMHCAYSISGISQLDYFDLYKKFTEQIRESYRLDFIAEVELGQKKLDHSEYKTFKDFYTNGWQKFIEYNIVDVELVGLLEDKKKLIKMALTMAYDAKVNLEDVFSQVRMWDSIIYNHLKLKNIVIPPHVRNNKSTKYAGAYVKEPIPGMYEYVVSFDLNSMYPHLIMQFNLSPETLMPTKHPSVTVDKILNQDLNFDEYSNYAIAANGAMYRKDTRGFLPEIMEKLYSERVLFKKKKLEAEQKYEETKNKKYIQEKDEYDNIQWVRKIQLNSAYGSLGNQYFRYYKLENAEAITLSGQVSIRWIMGKINVYFNNLLKTEDVDYIIASDTDSIYINMEPLIKKLFKGELNNTEKIIDFINQICSTKIEEYIDSSFQELADYLNSYEHKMIMKRECIADRAIWTAKKRYILNVWDSEGVRYSKPKLKIKGLEAIKSSTPKSCREMIKDTIEIIMNKSEEEVIEYINNAKKKFKELDPESISFPKTASDIRKYHSFNKIFIKGTPFHVRGALTFNHFVQKNGLNNKYSLIQNGEKIKYCYLKLPNTVGQNVISFIQEFPKEIVPLKYVDYDMQFEKAYLNPMRVILNSIGWNHEKVNTLESFFV